MMSKTSKVYIQFSVPSHIGARGKRKKSVILILFLFKLLIFYSSWIFGIDFDFLNITIKYQPQSWLLYARYESIRLQSTKRSTEKGKI